MDTAKQDLLRTIERLTREIVQCQNAMEAGIPCRGATGDHKDWLCHLQDQLAAAEVELTKLE